MEVGICAFEPQPFDAALATARSLEWPEWRPDEERLRDLAEWLDRLEALPERERARREPFRFQLGNVGTIDDRTGRVVPLPVYLTIRRS